MAMLAKIAHTKIAHTKHTLLFTHNKQ